MSDQGMVTGDPVSRSARAAARRLATTHGTELEAQVEAALYARGTNQRPNQYFDPVTLGSLIVSTAALAWTVYKDLRNKPSKITLEIITRRVRVELPAGDPTSQFDRDKIIEIVVEEIIKDAEE